MPRIPVQLNVYIFRASSDGLEALMLRRIPSRGGFWQCVSGGLMQNETLIEGAKREVFEETGVLLDMIYDSGYSFEYPINPSWKHKYLESDTKIVEYVFAGIVPFDVSIKISDEHDSLRWVRKDEALALLTEFETLRLSFNEAYKVAALKSIKS